jgi:hypothetical protein
MSFTLLLDRGFSDLNYLGVLAGLSAFAGHIVFQAREITHSPHPQLSAITRLATSIPLLVLSFDTLDHLTQRIAA